MLSIGGLLDGLCGLFLDFFKIGVTLLEFQEFLIFLGNGFDMILSLHTFLQLLEGFLTRVKEYLVKILLVALLPGLWILYLFSGFALN